MKATGIVRRIDDLGRIVIPKEIRRTQRIHEGDPIEIYTNRDGEIMLKKYSPIVELGEFASDYAESISMVTGGLACVTDRECVIAAAGPKKKEYIGKEVSKELDKLIEKRVTAKKASDPDKYIKIVTDEQMEHPNEVVSTIVCNGDSLGAVTLCGFDKGKIDGNGAMQLVQAAAIFLGKQLD